MGRTPLVLTVLTTAALAVAGCASSTGTGAGGASSSPQPELPAGLVVFQVETSGGFVPVDYALGARPTLTIYGDGTAFATRDDDSYHAVVALRRGSVDADRLAELIAAAQSSGVFGDLDYGMPGVTDLGTTTLSFRPRAGAPRTASAYALGFGDGDGALGLSEAQRARRQALSALIDDLVESVAFPADGGSWTPDRVQVLELTDSPSDERHAPAWPGPELATLLTRATGTGPCGELSGAEAATVFAAARAAQSSAWTAAGKTHHLVIRALLPGEPACAD